MTADAGVSAMQAATWAAVCTVMAGTKMVSYRAVSASGVSSGVSTHSFSGSRTERSRSTSSRPDAPRERSTRNVKPSPRRRLMASSAAASPMLEPV